MDQPQPKQERRKYYRIQDALSLDYQVLTPEEYEKENNLFLNQPSGIHTLKNKYSNLLPNGIELEQISGTESDLIRGLLKIMIDMNEKIDLILSCLEKKENMRIYTKPAQDVNLSADGIAFTVLENIPLKSYLKIKILLPEHPKLMITLLGQVLRIVPHLRDESGMQKFELGVTFLNIHEDDQEELIRYVFMKQRDMLRSRHN